MESIIRRILIYSPNNSGIHDPGYCDHAARRCTKDILTPNQCCSGNEKVLNCYKYLSRFNCNKSGCALSDKYGAWAFNFEKICKSNKKELDTCQKPFYIH